jgi:hypothetical protein
LNNLNLASLGGLINSAKSNRELVYIRKYLKDVPDVTTRDEVERILWTECPTNLKDIIARNDPFTAPNVYPLIYAASSFINVGVPSQPARHRLYLNVDSDCTYLLANKLREKCNELKLQYEYKFQPDGTRDDSFVVYCTDENLMLFIDILEKLRKDNVRLKNGIKKPPILTAVYNYYRRLLHASISDMKEGELAKAFGIQEFAAKKIKAQSAKFTKRSLKKAVDYLVDMDYKIKSGLANQDEGMWQTVFKIMLDK